MALHKTRVRPIKLRLRSPTLSCDVLRGVAYRAECACGWRGPSRGAFRPARHDALDHARQVKQDEHERGERHERHEVELHP